MPHYGNVSPSGMGGTYWTFPARLVAVIDGDTMDVDCDLGFQTRREVRIRLYGVDTAEIYGQSKDSEEYKEGIRHRDFAESWIMAIQSGAAADEFPLRLLSKKRIGIYGRYTGDLIDPATGASLVDALIQEFDL